MLAGKGFSADGLAAPSTTLRADAREALCMACAGAGMDSRILVKQRTTTESPKTNLTNT